MRGEIDPIVGNWYRHLDKGQMFLVIAVDDAEATIELQHFDGDIEEVSMVAWRAMDLELIDAPEDWTGPMDDIEPDDLGYSSETVMSDADWRAPLQEVARDSHEPWEDTAARGRRAAGDNNSSREELWEPQDLDSLDKDTFA